MKTHLPLLPDRMDRLDITGEPSAFAKHKWIGLGKKYPDNLPPELWAYRDAAFETPVEKIKEFIPDYAMSVRRFLSCKLPAQAVVLVIPDSRPWFFPSETNRRSPSSQDTEGSQ